MVLPGHLSAGYVASVLALSFNGYSASDSVVGVVTLIGIVSGSLPDIDLVWLYFKHKNDLPSDVSKLSHTSKQPPKIDDHREFITHTPLFWILLCSLSALLGWLFSSPATILISLTVLLGTLSHLLLDAIEHGSRLLWPFSLKRFYLLEVQDKPIIERQGSIKYHWTFITRRYARHPSFYIEILLTLIVIIWVILSNID